MIRIKKIRHFMAGLFEKSDLFRGLGAGHQKQLAAISLRRKFGKKEHLFLEGQKGHSLFLLAEGAVRLYKTSPEGREAIIKIVRPGEIFAEVILFEQDHYPVSAVALKESIVHLIAKKQFYGLLAGEGFRNDFIRSLLEKHRYLTRRILDLTSHEVQERLFIFLRDQYGPLEEIVPAISKKDMAATIGTTPETFSRLLLSLKKKKILTWENKTLRLCQGFWTHPHPVTGGRSRE